MKTHPVYSEADSVVNPRQDQWSRGKELSLIEIGVACEFYLRAHCAAQNAEIFAVLFDALVLKRWHLQGFEKHQGTEYIVNIINFSTLQAPMQQSQKYTNTGTHNVSIHFFCQTCGFGAFFDQFWCSRCLSNISLF